MLKMMDGSLAAVVTLAAAAPLRVQPAEKAAADVSSVLGPLPTPAELAAM